MLRTIRTYEQFDSFCTKTLVQMNTQTMKNGHGWLCVGMIVVMSNVEFWFGSNYAKNLVICLALIETRVQQRLLLILQCILKKSITITYLKISSTRNRAWPLATRGSLSLSPYLPTARFINTSCAFRSFREEIPAAELSSFPIVLLCMLACWLMTL